MLMIWKKSTGINVEHTFKSSVEISDGEYIQLATSFMMQICIMYGMNMGMNMDFVV